MDPVMMFHYLRRLYREHGLHAVKKAIHELWFEEHDSLYWLMHAYGSQESLAVAVSQ